MKQVLYSKILSETVFTFTFVLITRVCVCQETEPIPVLENEVFSPGAYFEEQDVNLYDTVYPIVFKFKQPEWLEQNRILLNNCTDDKWSENSVMGSLCPVFYYLQQDLHDKLNTAMGLPTLSMAASNTAVNFDCDLLTRHFFMERLTNEKFNEYLVRLKVCSDFNIYESDLINDMSKKLSTSYDKMVKRFMEEYYNKMPKNARVNKAAEMNDKLAISSLLYSHYLLMAKKWRRGFRDCKRGFVPENFISHSKLRTALEKLGKKLITNRVDNSTYNYTIPYEGTQISRYYKAPIADCVYTVDKFYVRLLVPVTKVRKSPVKLLKIKPIPFFTDEKGPQQLCMLKGFSKSPRYSSSVEEIQGGRVASLATKVSCDTTNFKMCKIPDPFETYEDPTTACARALILYNYDPSPENDAAIVKVCPLECNDLRSDRMPIIVRAHDKQHTVYLITDPTKNRPGIDVECQRPEQNPTPNQEIQMETYFKLIPAAPRGALAIVLSCECRISIGAHNILAGPECIHDDLLSFKVTPFHNAAKKPEAKAMQNKPADVSPEDAA